MGEVSDDQLRFIVEQRRSTVNNNLSGGKPKDALLESLRSPPVGAKDQSIKDYNSETVMNVLVSVKESEIKSLIAGLNVTQQEALLKFVYKGFELAQRNENFATLLKWHEQLVEVGGLAAIVRCFADRKTT